MNQLRVSLLQMCIDDNNVSKNLETILQAIDRAHEDKADILLTPEGALSGYHHRFDQAEVAAALAKVESRAAEKGVGLALGVCIEEDDGKRYNEVRVYDKTGRFLGFHSKILRCSPPKPDCDPAIPYYREHINFAAVPLRTFDFHGVNIGVLICNDMWANPQYTGEDDPHLLQKLSQMGAKLVLHAVNSYCDDTPLIQITTRNYHEANLQIRALAAEIPVATVNNASCEGIPVSCPGGCIGVDGEWLMKLPDTLEQQLTYCFDLV